MKMYAARFLFLLATLTMLLMVAGCTSDDSSTAERSTDNGSSRDEGPEELPESESKSEVKDSDTDEDSTVEKSSTSTSTKSDTPEEKEKGKKSSATSSSSSSTTGPTFKQAEIDGPWGHLKGQFIFTGDAPSLANLTVTKDPAFCGRHDIPNETIVVNSENGGIANVIIYLYVKRGADPLPTHPSYDETATAEVRFDNENCRFVPHVCLLRTSQTLVVGNKDAVGHNTKVDAYNNSPINPLTPAGQDFKHQFSIEERSPVAVSCSIHPWMSGWILVRGNPYSAATDKDGNFEIKNLPEGEWAFNVWHEVTRGVDNVKVNGAPTEWKRGRATVAIKAGHVTDWGKVEVAPELFKE